MSELLLLEQVKVGDKDKRRKCWTREYLTFVPSLLSGSLPPAGQDRGGDHSSSLCPFPLLQTPGIGLRSQPFDGTSGIKENTAVVQSIF